MPTYRVGVRLKAFDAGFGGVLRRAAGAAGRSVRGAAGGRAGIVGLPPRGRRRGDSRCDLRARGIGYLTPRAPDAEPRPAGWCWSPAPTTNLTPRAPDAEPRRSVRGEVRAREVERGGIGPGVVDQSVHVTIHGSVYAEDRERLLDDLVDRVRDAQWERLL